jgi:hypothetical protein
VIQWKRRSGGKKTAHAFVEDDPLCPVGDLQPGMPSAFGKVTEWVPLGQDELTALGKPYGNVCQRCAAYTKD